MSTSDTVAIRGVAAGGDGVGTLPDGRTVFVPRTAPGDTVRLRSVRRHARFARAEIAEVVEPGPGRVEPPCLHYVRDRCGSCQLQHLDSATQQGVRRTIVGDAMRRIARLDREDPPMLGDGPPFGYRARITLTVRHGAIGYHRHGAPDQIMEITSCLLASEPVRTLHAAVRRGRRHLPRDAEQVSLREDAEGGLHVVVRTAGEGTWTDAAALAAELPDGVHLWWHPAGGAARVVAGSADPFPATVFAQVNPAVASAVRRAALDALGPVSGARVWDLYAGIGESTAALADAGAQVASVERDPRAVRHAVGVGPAGPDRRVGDVADHAPRLPAPDLVLTNPPRLGMEESVTAVLRESGAGRLVYISCDPATLARDIGRLSPAYRLADLTAWDQFPQTAHVECVATLERR